MKAPHLCLVHHDLRWNAAYLALRRSKIDGGSVALRDLEFPLLGELLKDVVLAVVPL